MNKLIFDEQGTLRSGWRVALFLFVFVFLSGIFIFGSMPLVALLPEGSSVAGYLPLVVPFAISTVFAIVLGWLFGRLFERVPFGALGCSFSNNWLRHFALGGVVGSVAFISAVAVAMMSGGMSFAFNHTSTSTSIWRSLLVTFVIFAVSAISEETLFRGYPLQTFARSNLIPMGVGVTSVLFAFAHNNNPDVNGLALFNTFLAGIWFATAYLKTRDLWFPFGIHLMWNWLQGPVFGITVSGISELNPDPVLHATDIGPAWLTGGSYGIEGGVACTIAVASSIAAIWFLPNLHSQANLTADKTDDADMKNK